MASEVYPPKSRQLEALRDKGRARLLRTAFELWTRMSSGGPRGGLVAAQLLVCLLFSGKILLADLPGRVLYRDGSPCAFCWLDLEIPGHSSRLRVDADGYFQLPVRNADEIRRLRADDQAGDRILEKDFLFFVLHKNNPMVEPLLKQLRSRLQLYEQGMFRETTQQVVLENCILSVERLSFVQGRVLESRLVEADLTVLQKVEVCADDRACIHLVPARVEGERNELDGAGGAVFFDSRHRDDVPFLLQSVSLLARGCGNLSAAVSFQ